MIRHEPKFKAGDTLMGIGNFYGTTEIVHVGEEKYFYKNSIGEGAMKFRDMEQFYQLKPKEALVTREMLAGAWERAQHKLNSGVVVAEESNLFKVLCKYLGL